MSPGNTYKLMGFYMEVLILGVILYFSTWFLLLLAVSYRVYRVKHVVHSILFEAACR